MTAIRMLTVFLVLSAPRFLRAQDQEAGAVDQHVADIAGEFKVDPKEVAALRQKGMDWEDVGHALVLSEKSGKPLAEVVSLREKGKTWGETALKLGFEPDESKKRAQRIGRDGKRAEHADRDRSRRDRPERSWFRRPVRRDRSHGEIHGGPHSHVVPHH